MIWNRVSTDSDFEKAAAYSRAIYDDEWVFVSGTTGFDYTTMTISEDVGEQAEQMWKNVAAALESAGSGLDEIVSFLLILTSREYLAKSRPVLKKVIPHKPSGTAIICDLIDERMKIEVQVTAKRKATVKVKGSGT
jgi:enamine deaminase RidA (YjgF/YER057c/UK114 family)